MNSQFMIVIMNWVIEYEHFKPPQNVMNVFQFTSKHIYLIKIHIQDSYNQHTVEQHSAKVRVSSK